MEPDPPRNEFEASRQQDVVFNAPFYKSIRFRLTAWYATTLFLIMVALAISLHALLVRALTDDAESRLGNAASEIAPKIGFDDSQIAPFDPSTSTIDLNLEPPDLDSILLSGLWFQIFDINHNAYHVDSSGALAEPPEDLAHALGDTNVFDVSRNTYKTITVNGTESLILVAPLHLNINDVQGPTTGWVVVGEPLGSRDKIIEVVDQVLRIFGIFGVGLAVWGGWLMAGRALEPVGRITQTADAIARSGGVVSHSSRLDVPSTGDELSQLAFTFNVMLERIESAFNTQRRFVSDASHELRTPLTAVRGNVDVLLRQLKSDRTIDKEDVVEELGVVQRESGRMSRLIDDMLVLARTDATNFGDILKLNAVSLEVLAREAFRTASQLGTGQTLELVVGSPVTLYGDGDRLVQVMIILLENAIRHTPSGGTVELRVDRDLDPAEGVMCARIQVRDTGSGISIEHVPHLFERFYRVESARTRSSGGTGLGLSIALAIVRGHHGWIDVDTAPGEGATFTVWLPLAENAEPHVGDDDEPTDTAARRVKRALRKVSAFPSNRQPPPQA